MGWPPSVGFSFARAEICCMLTIDNRALGVKVGPRSPMKKTLRKRRTREHVIADLSVNFVERQVLLCGFTVERMVHDYGVDLEVFTFNRQGEIEEGKILVQVKASDRLRIQSGKTDFPQRIARADLVFWLAQPMPVILIVYDAAQDVAYWLYVQSHFARRKDFNLFAAGKELTIQIPTRQSLNANAFRRFARFRDRILEQVKEVIHDQD